MRVAILRTQVPFITGGAESLASDFKAQLEARSIGGTPIEADVVTLPFLWYPPLEVVNQVMLWRLLNLREVDGKPIDLVIPLKFPTYFVQHSNVRPWLMHQHRQAYDLYETPFGDLHQTAEGRDVATYIRELDTTVLTGLPIKVISTTVRDRLLHYNKISSDVLYPPPPDVQRYEKSDDFRDFILAPGRLDGIKRQDLLINALVQFPQLKAVIIGDGPRRDDWQILIDSQGLSDRIRILGQVDVSEKVRLYKSCLAVYNAPYNEDYGLITVEAFLSGKPVLTTNDSGGVLEFVRDELTGVVGRPDVSGVVDALDRLVSGGGKHVKILGDRAYQAIRELDITWDHVIRELLS